MFSFCKKSEETPASRVVDVGWLLDTEKGAMIWDAPRKMSRPTGRTTHAKGVSVCPAVTDHELRLFEVTCPVDIQLRYKPNGEEPGLQVLPPVGYPDWPAGLLRSSAHDFARFLAARSQPSIAQNRAPSAVEQPVFA